MSDKNKQNDADLKEMLASSDGFVMLHEDGSETEVDTGVQYESWWNRYRASWLQSEKMTEEEIQASMDDAWDVSDYKECIYLMAELICRLQQK